MRFSKRLGYEEEPPLQFECMSDQLKKEIHNIIRYIEEERNWKAGNHYEKLKQIYGHLWSHFFILDSDDFKRYHANSGTKEVKKLYDQLAWNRVYDDIEEYCRLISIFALVSYNNLCDLLNSVLRKHNSAYRMLDGRVIPISNEKEIEEISEASHTQHVAINRHLKNSIILFSDRVNPDYPNTVNEAIKAVEAAANIINGSTDKTLGDALKAVDKKSPIHLALIDSFIKIYGYTSDKHSGVRHASFDGSTCIPDFADAKFMLVACSAFVNYLIQKASS